MQKLLAITMATPQGNLVLYYALIVRNNTK